MNDLAIKTADDGFAVADRDGENLIRGKMLKFTDGNFIADKTEAMPANLNLVAMAMITAWVHWVDGKPIEHRITLAGENHPEREELPDQDESLWPPGLNDQPTDPWRDTRYLHLIDPRDGSDYTFITDSFGGRRAISDLKSKIANVRCARPSAVPIIQLAKTTMKTRFGTKPRPDFKVVDWYVGQAQATALQALSAGKSPDMDDEIPF